jgi:hypothetical protein
MGDINLGTIHPVYKGTYDANVAYEFLNRVDDGNGKTYEAKSAVPAGSDLTDASLWQLIFDSNKNLEVDSIKTGNAVSGGVGQRLLSNELKQYGANGNTVYYNTYDDGTGAEISMRNSEGVVLAGITIRENGNVENMKTKEVLADTQEVNIYMADESNAYILSENVWGDTACGIKRVWIKGSIVGNVATLSVRLEVLDFFVTLPSDATMFFEYNLLARLKSFTDVTSFYSDAYADAIIDMSADCNIVPCRMYTNHSGMLRFYANDMTNLTDGGNSFDSSLMEVMGTISFLVRRG